LSKILSQRREEMMHYNGQKSGCQSPEKLKGKPKDCTPKQIKECHGSIRKHPCFPMKNKKK
jgi:hypothetical protein